MEFFIKVIGILLVIEGMPWFLSPQRMRQWFRQVLAVSDRHLRLAGCLLMFLGLALVFFITR